ncbi:MAG: cytochrome c3 family protein [Gammaproteobacteria bacterium]|nr:cytochrome c3 family protein [Gammaproteobacteria bacterium]
MQLFFGRRLLSCQSLRSPGRSLLLPLGFVVALFAAAPLLAEVPNAVAPTETYSGDQVEQPIEFPHDIHAKVNKINCMYCHTYARRSKVAGIPPTSKCMGCHTVIATDKPRIKKLTEYWEKGESPKWKKVHDLPDYVHFTHEKHLQRFIFDNKDMKVENASEVCAFCHGEIKDMTVAQKSRPLTMGFCRRCHEQNKGPFDCWKCHK